MLSLFSTFFIVIADAAVNKGFATYVHPCGDRTFLAYPYLLTSDSEGVSIVVVSTIGLLMYCVLGLAVVLFVLLRLPKKAHDVTFRRSTLSLVVKFGNSTPWWFFLVLLVNLMVTLSIVLFDDVNFQIMYTSVVLICYMCLLVSYRPYRCPASYYSDVVTTFGKLFILLGFSLYNEDSSSGAETVVTFCVISTYCVSTLIFFWSIYMIIQSRVCKKVFPLTTMFNNVGNIITDKFPHAQNIMELADNGLVSEDPTQNAKSTENVVAVETELRTENQQLRKDNTKLREEIEKLREESPDISLDVSV
jgi:hypothetical protein